jgi:glucosamine-6-phosphate deaminase
MEVVVLDSAESAARFVANAVVRLVQRNPRAVLGLATGSSPALVYADLSARCQRGEVSFAGTLMFLLDEYIGLPVGHPQAYATVIDAELTGHLDVPAGAVHGLNPQAPDVEEECRRYERAIVTAGGIDLQILGIGRDGHIGFNEPGSSLGSRTRIKTLAHRTRQDNARFFDSDEEVPHHVLTQGLATISEARHLVLIATGQAKADAVAAAVEGPVSAFCPASVLQLHPHVTVVLDELAASKLRLRDYFRETYAAKPVWQDI